MMSQQLTSKHTFLAAARWLALGMLALSGLAQAVMPASPSSDASSGTESGSALAPASSLQSIAFEAVDDSQSMVVMRFDGEPAAPKGFYVEQPTRVTLDFIGITSMDAPKVQSVNRAGVSQIVAAQTNERLRVVVSLTQQVAWEVEKQGNEVRLRLKAASSNAASVSTSVAPTVANISGQQVALATAARPSLTDVDFSRGAQGSALLKLQFSSDRVAPSVRKQGRSFVVDVAQVEVPQRFARRYDTGDFGTNVSGFEVERKRDGARVQLSTQGEVEHAAWLAGDIWTLEVRPVVEKKAVKRFPYSGQKVNLNFQDIEVRALLEILADVAKLNIVVSDTVRGSITLRLNEVPWDQALDIILSTKGFDKRKVGNIIYVAPFDELAAREEKERATALKKQKLAPLQSELLQINYAKATDLASLIRGSESATLLSERGTVTVDDRTNSLLINDTAQKQEEIRDLVSRLDVPVEQVLIESRIVIASDNFKKELGVRFGGTLIRDVADHGVLFSGSGDATDIIMDSLSDGDDTTEVGSFGDRVQVSMPVKSPAGRFGLSILGSGYLLDLELSALQAEGKGEVVSNPRVITANQQEASIEQGVEVPFQTASQSGTNVQFKKATLRLAVVPQITPDNRIIMDLEINKDAVGREVPSGISGGFVPTIDTRAIKTQVLVEDGQTVVLGGIYETTRSEGASKVPILGDLPVFGRLFRSTLDKNDKVELLIFVTPKILHEGVDIAR